MMLPFNDRSPLRSETLGQAVWARRGGQAGRSGGGGVQGDVGASESESDVSATSLEETVRIPLERWPDSLLLTAEGIRKEALAVELLAKVRQLGVWRRLFSVIFISTNVSSIQKRPGCDQ